MKTAINDCRSFVSVWNLALAIPVPPHINRSTTAGRENVTVPGQLYPVRETQPTSIYDKNGHLNLSLIGN